MAKTLAPAIIEELRRLKINAPPAPAFEKGGANPRIVAASALAAERRVAEIEGGGAHTPADARDSCSWRDRGPGPAVWRASPAQSAD
jgi:hypothetical protein